MLGSGPDDGDDGDDVLEMGPRKPPRAWPLGRRGRLIVAVAGVCALLTAGAFTGLRLTARQPADPALARLVTEVTTVPVSTAAAGRSGFQLYAGLLPSGTPSALSSSLSDTDTDGFPVATEAAGRPLTVGGKPEVLYIATEYCPYCVAKSWPLIVALSRFGQFAGLATSRSPRFESIAPIDGWTFYGSSYTSPYLAFASVEMYSNVLVSPKADPDNPKSYHKLQRLTAAEQAVFSKFDAGRATPFIDFGGTAVALGSDIDPSALSGLTWSQIAADLRRPNSTAGAAILFSADFLASELCQLTGDRPAAACPTWIRRLTAR